MSLGPVKAVAPDLATQMSQSWIDPVDEDARDKSDQKNKDGEEAARNTSGNTRKDPSKDAHLILKKAVEAEVQKVNILDKTGKKIEPDVSGMVINILT